MSAQPAVLLKLVNFTSDFILSPPPVFHTFFPEAILYIIRREILYSLYIHDSTRKPEPLYILQESGFVSRYVKIYDGLIILPAFAIVSTMLYMFVTVPTASLSFRP